MSNAGVCHVFEAGRKFVLRGWLGCCFILAAWAGALPAPAQNASKDIPQFDVFVGFDGVVTEGDWFPVVCEVRNEGPSFNAVFEFQEGNLAGGLVRRLSVELPSGTLKRFGFPMFASTRYNSQYTAILRNERGRVVAQSGNIQPRLHINWQSRLLAAMPASAAGMPVLPEDLARNFSAKPVATAARIQPEMLPDNPLSMEGMDSLYLNSQRAVDLSEPQVEALMSWLHGGGHLIIGVDAVVDVNGVAWLKSLVPGELGTVRTVPLGDRFDQWLHDMPPATPAPLNGGLNDPYQVLRGENSFNASSIRIVAIKPEGARIDLAVGSDPLVVSQRRGRGKVTVLLFNPEQEPIRSWKLRPYFWARLDEIPGYLIQQQPPPNQGSTGVDGVIGALVDSKQVRKLPVSALLGLLVVYLLVIGPFDQWWLKRINRQMLTWITFPCYVVMFSVLIYVIGYKLRAGESEWNEIQFVDVIPKGSGAEYRGTTYGSLYSPVNASYQLGGRQRFAALRGEYLGAVANRATDGNMVLKADQYDAEVNVPVWTSQTYVGQWLDEGSLPASATLRRGDKESDFEITLTNRELPAGAVVRVALGDRLHRVNFPERGKSLTVLLPGGGGTRIEDFVNSATSLFYQAAAQRNQGFGSDEARWQLDPVDSSMAVTLSSFVSTAQHNTWGYAGQFLSPGHLELSPLLRQDFAVVMIWCENYSPTAPLNQFTPRRTSRSTLLRLAVPLDSKEI